MFWAKTGVALVTAALAATASAANKTGPYHLHIQGTTNTSINGNAGACHAGAAIEGLCYVAGPAPTPSENYYEFYYNYGSYDPTTGAVNQPGWISWLLQIGSGESAMTVESAMRLESGWGSNVATALFYPDNERGAHLWFVPDSGEMYATGNDDAYATVAYPEGGLPQSNWTNFHLCYQFTGGYWYQSIAWVYTLPPHNPTCEPVSLSLVTVS